MVLRTRSKAAAEEPQVQNQLDQYCFMFDGTAAQYSHNTVQGGTIQTWPISSLNYHILLETLQDRSITDPAVLYPPLTGFPRESEPAQPPGTISCVVVGIAAPERAKKKPLSTHPKATPVGMQIIPRKTEKTKSYTTVHQLDDEEFENWVRVVVPVEDAKPGNMIKLYALINAAHELCHPYTINGDEVFFFSCFRDASKSMEARRKEWINKIRERSVTKTGATMTNDQQRRFKRAHDTTKIICRPETSLANELQLFAHAFAEKKQPWILDELKELLELADPDLTSMPSVEALQAFLDLDQPFDASARAAEVAEALTRLWPDATVDANTIATLRRGLEQTELPLPYRMLRGFVAEGHVVVSETNLSPTSGGLDNIVKSLRDRVARILGPEGPSRLSMKPGDTGLLLRAIVQQQASIVQAFKESSRNVRDLVGDTLLPDDLASIFEVCGKSMDLDNARQAFHHAFRYSYLAAGQRMDAAANSLTELSNTVQALYLREDGGSMGGSSGT